MRAQGFVGSGERAPEEMVAAVADSVVSGLAAIHARKQLHRDVKPGNVSALSFYYRSTSVYCAPYFLSHLAYLLTFTDTINACSV